MTGKKRLQKLVDALCLALTTVTGVALLMFIQWPQEEEERGGRACGSGSRGS